MRRRHIAVPAIFALLVALPLTAASAQQEKPEVLQQRLADLLLSNPSKLVVERPGEPGTGEGELTIERVFFIERCASNLGTLIVGRLGLAALRGFDLDWGKVRAVRVDGPVLSWRAPGSQFSLKFEQPAAASIVKQSLDKLVAAC